MQDWGYESSSNSKPTWHWGRGLRSPLTRARAAAEWICPRTPPLIRRVLGEAYQWRLFILRYYTEKLKTIQRTIAIRRVLEIYVQVVKLLLSGREAVADFSVRGLK